MASINEVKNAIARANELARQGDQGLAQSSAKLDEAISTLSKAVDGGGHELITQAQAALKKAKESISTARRAVAQSQESAQRYAKSI